MSQNDLGAWRRVDQPSDAPLTSALPTSQFFSGARSHAHDLDGDGTDEFIVLGPADDPLGVQGPTHVDVWAATADGWILRSSADWERAVMGGRWPQSDVSSGMTLRDVNGDDRVDLVAEAWVRGESYERGDTLSPVVALGRPDGSFEDPRGVAGLTATEDLHTWSLLESTTPETWITALVDGSTLEVGVFDGETGTLRLVSTSPVPVGVTRTVTGDFDGDGLIDLMLADDRGVTPMWREPVHGPLDLPEAEDPDPPGYIDLGEATPTTPAARTIYVNFDGVAEWNSGTVHDATTNTSTFNVATSPPFDQPALEPIILERIRQAFAPFDVLVTDARPENGDYTMAVITRGNEPTDLDCRVSGGSGTGKSFCFNFTIDCSDAFPNDVIILSIYDIDEFTPTSIAATTLVYLGHSYGLGATTDPDDAMSGSTEADGFHDGCVALDPDAPCFVPQPWCGRMEQDSHRTLAENVGLKP